MKYKIFFIIILLLILGQTTVLVFADEGEEWKIFDLDAEKLLNLGSSLMAFILFILTSMAYRRSGRKRMIFISVAFLLFAVKTFLIGAEVMFGEWLWVDTVASILDFGILLSFFFGVIRK